MHKLRNLLEALITDMMGQFGAEDYRGSHRAHKWSI